MNNGSKTTGTARKRAKAQGSIMLEYVIVVCGLGAALTIFLTRTFFDVSTGFGPLGRGVVAFYQRLLGGLALPVP